MGLRIGLLGRFQYTPGQLETGMDKMDELALGMACQGMVRPNVATWRRFVEIFISRRRRIACWVLHRLPR